MSARCDVSAGAALRDLAASVPKSLVPPDQLSELQLLADRLPMTTGAGLECPLQPGAATGWCVRFRTDDERASLAGLDGLNEPWPRIRALGGRWLREAAAWPVRNVWLEFDSARHSSPSVFFDTGGPARAASADPWFWLDVAGLLQGQSVRREVVDRVLACLDALPSTGFLGYAGVMLGRADAALRLTFDGLGAADAVPLLERFGRRESALAAAVASVGHLDPRVVLHLDVDAGIGTTLGAEIFARDWRPMLEPLLAHLGKSEFVEPLLGWTGVSPAISLGPRNHLLRRLNHIKVVEKKDTPLAAKAYLYYGLWQTGGNGGRS
ncbi:MAG TPA: hypothetical protein VF432_02895 [Thermoanaerobaculia bacterium]